MYERQRDEKGFSGNGWYGVATLKGFYFGIFSEFLGIPLLLPNSKSSR